MNDDCVDTSDTSPAPTTAPMGVDSANPRPMKTDSDFGCCDDASDDPSDSAANSLCARMAIAMMENCRASCSDVPRATPSISEWNDSETASSNAMPSLGELGLLGSVCFGACDASGGELWMVHDGWSTHTWQVRGD